MKLLVSDYDDTIKVMNFFGNSYIPKDTINNINDFRSNGNLFMIATARTYNSIMFEVKDYSIPYDFISCLNGACIYDRDGLIFSKDMVEFNIDRLKKIYSCIYKIEQFKDKDKTLYYYFYIKLLESSKRIIEYLKSFNVYVNSYFFNKINVVSPMSDKVDSIKFIQDLYGIIDDDVITIGDGFNDLSMIHNYYSFGVRGLFSNREVLKFCNKRVKSLNDAFNYIKDI
jgi:HAD superfamily hydrolase (TIGR01484 family)